MSSPAASTALFVTSLTLAISPGPAMGQAWNEWLPPPVEDGVVQQLAERLVTLPTGGRPPLTTEQRLDRARNAVSSLRGVIEGWGLDGVLGRAPDFAGLTLPAAGDRLLDGMGRYQLCNFVLALQLAPEGKAEDLNLQLTGVLGSTAATMAVLYLRHPFVEAGGSHQEIEAFLTSDEIERVGAMLQDDAQLLEGAQSSCSPVMVELVTAILK